MRIFFQVILPILFSSSFVFVTSSEAEPVHPYSQVHLQLSKTKSYEDATEFLREAFLNKPNDIEDFFLSEDLIHLAALSDFQTHALLSLVHTRTISIIESKWKRAYPTEERVEGYHKVRELFLVRMLQEYRADIDRIRSATYDPDLNVYLGGKIAKKFGFYIFDLLRDTWSGFGSRIRGLLNEQQMISPSMAENLAATIEKSLAPDLVFRGLQHRQHRQLFPDFLAVCKLLENYVALLVTGNFASEEARSVAARPLSSVVEALFSMLHITAGKFSDGDYERMATTWIVVASPEEQGGDDALESWQDKGKISERRKIELARSQQPQAALAPGVDPWATNPNQYRILGRDAWERSLRLLSKILLQIFPDDPLLAASSGILLSDAERMMPELMRSLRANPNLWNGPAPARQPRLTSLPMRFPNGKTIAPSSASVFQQLTIDIVSQEKLGAFRPKTGDHLTLMVPKEIVQIWEKRMKPDPLYVGFEMHRSDDFKYYILTEKLPTSPGLWIETVSNAGSTFVFYATDEVLPDWILTAERPFRVHLNFGSIYSSFVPTEAPVNFGQKRKRQKIVKLLSKYMAEEPGAGLLARHLATAVAESERPGFLELVYERGSSGRKYKKCTELLIDMNVRAQKYE